MYTSTKHLAIALLAIGLVAAAPAARDNHAEQPLTSSIRNVQVGPRPFWLIDNMDEGPLKERLQSCQENTLKTTQFAISHRGAPLMFPEHSKEGYAAAARMGAGIIECDVSFTSDRELVCRHSNCDLHYTTNVLSKPELAAKCTKPFVPYNNVTGENASAKCCTSDFTLAEFKSLCAEMEATTLHAMNITSAAPYFGRIGTTPDWRTNLYAYECATPVSLKEQIAQVQAYGLNFTAELKTPEVKMPFQGNYTQQIYAQQLIDTFKELNISPDRVWLQSFLADDIFQWIDTEPEFARQAVYLDERADKTPGGYQQAVASLPGLAARGVKIIAPSIYQLITVDNCTDTIVPSSYAIAAQKAGLEIITWSFERSGPFSIEDGGYYYSSVKNLITTRVLKNEFTVLDVIAQQVKATKVFSDWVGTASYYGNCFGL